ncbi:hypothetical protein PQR14_27530 [Paraburkholderia bryophila]|uniref:AbiTii domain-containing protein n=1 Tax=Paraburkholderia bryophila TaxID=420952 RepID=UPI0038BD02E2
MKLLNEIIDLLSDKSGSLTDAMLKTKVLLHRIGHKELAQWVSEELNGYGQGKSVPSYRVIGIRLVGHVQNSGWRHENISLPTAHLSDDLHKRLTVAELNQSVGALEQYAVSTHSLTSSVPPEFYKAISTAFDNGWVTTAWTQIEATQIVGVLIEIRSRLLDFALNLQDQIGDVPEDDMKDAAKTIDASGMFTSAIYGDNHTFIIGNSNVTTIANTVTKGDFNSLADTLKKAGVDAADVEELKTAIEQDDPTAVAEQKQFGPKVRAWMAKMTSKAIDGGWTIGLAAGGKLLADALGAHYGIK